ncbi:MAG: DUF86 domain-containing protein [Deltaproteobacteria bacterium]|jgi:uncharacterized protein with HEPN domain|nr:DUF86 domain-containing protein [Deltaproteobacteria bacterium]
MSKRKYLHFLEDILKAIQSIEQFVNEMDFDSFIGDEKTQRAVERELEIIGEAVKNIPEVVTSEYPLIPWKAVAGMRNRLIHHYWNTEVEILWKTIKKPLPQLKNTIENMIKSIKRNKQ